MNFFASPPAPPTPPPVLAAVLGSPAQFFHDSSDESKLIGTLLVALLLLLRSTGTQLGRNLLLLCMGLLPPLLLLAAPGTLSFLRSLDGLDQPHALSAIFILGAALVIAFSFTGRAAAASRAATRDAAARVNGAPVGAAARDEPPTTPPTAATARLIADRRSVFPKDFSGRAVPRAVLERMLLSANWAPTHGKTEPWRFVVFHGPTALAEFHQLRVSATSRALEGRPDALSAAMVKLDKQAAELRNVGAVLAIVLKRRRNPKKDKLMPEWEEVAACACAVQNAHLQCTAEGYHGYWSTGGTDAGGWATDSAVLERLGAAGECDGARDKLLGFFYVGHSDRVGTYKPKREPIAGKVDWVGSSAGED